MRLEELTNLTLRDIDFNEKSIKVLGKGGKERYANFDDKTTEKLLVKYLEKLKNIHC